MEQTKITSKQKTILFVDADKILIHDIKEYLKNEKVEAKFGLNFIFVENARDTLKKLEEMKIDLVILEILLPIVNGHYLINAIKKINKEMPIIVYTKLKGPQDLAKMASSEIDNIFIKNLMKPEDLIKIIAERDDYKTELDRLVPELKSQIKALSLMESQSQVKVVHCPKCNLVLSSESHFCNNCGQKIVKEIKKIKAKHAPSVLSGAKASNTEGAKATKK
jgi:CheY-like chemotaxis protein